jgi:hypothetical protein
MLRRTVDTEALVDWVEDNSYTFRSAYNEYVVYVRKSALLDAINELSTPVKE